MYFFKKWDIIQMKFFGEYRSCCVVSVDKINQTYAICPTSWSKSSAHVIKFEDLSDNICLMGRASIIKRIFNI